MAHEDTCIMCGNIIPEGYGLTCYACNNKFSPKTDLYEIICNKLTDFEHCEDKETTDADWLQEFYSLLVSIQNAFDCGDIKITSR